MSHAFEVKAFHLDLRIQVMTMDALKGFARQMSELGLNALVMEWEASYPYEQHAVISNRDAYTREELREFITYCNDMGIEVIPLQQCFGHIEYILQHNRYRHLREDNKDVSQCCPVKADAARELFSKLFEDMVSLHPSKYFHLGCDETWILGKCPACQEFSEQHSRSRLFIDYVAMLCEVVVSLGKIPIIWADIVLKYPEASDRLPKEIILVDWNYGWDLHPGVAELVKQGHNLWGAPSLRSSPDDYFTTGWLRHFKNLREFVPHCHASKFSGMVMTSWSTSGGYGYYYDQGYQVREFYPIRNVYPLNGFNLLIGAYASSLQTAESLELETFTVEYFKAKTGITSGEATTIWQILNRPQPPVYLGREYDSYDYDAECKIITEEIGFLGGLKEHEEISHLIMMLKLRYNYLKVRQLEAYMQSSDYTLVNRPEIRQDLLTLQQEIPVLEREFTRLQTGFLKPAVIEDENRNRRHRLEVLLQRTA
ncbi:MAG: family 20 glycosylhydrolase [Planctomycetes bacterium]|nr:family 20 glycosylhydrolase [Planctomycetota bacterium]